MGELEKLETLPSLVELSVVSNPVCITLHVQDGGNKIWKKKKKSIYGNRIHYNVITKQALRTINILERFSLFVNL